MAAEVLRSAAWWSGVSLQGSRFALTMLARYELLLLVQSCVVTALAVTALVQHVNGWRRLRFGDAVAIGGLVLAVGMLAAAVQPGRTPQTQWLHVAVLAVCAGVAAAGLVLRHQVSPLPAALVHGSLAGPGFGFSAIAARLIVGEDDQALWRITSLPLLTWVTGALPVVGLGRGQWHLTRGSAMGSSTGTSGCMYVASTLVPAVVGWAYLGEQTVPGSTGLIVVALVIGSAALAG